MKYTKEIPTKPGWYWVRGPGYKGIHLLLEYYDTLVFNVMGERYNTNDRRFEYAGPIPEPEEA